MRILVRYFHEEAGLAPTSLLLRHLDTRHVLGFLDHLERTRGNSARTRNHRLGAIRSFLQFVSLEEPVSLPSVSRVLARDTTKRRSRIGPCSCCCTTRAPGSRRWRR